MNREILFRGKRDDNGEWVYGYFVADALEQIGRDCPMGWIRYYNDDTEKVEIYQIDRKTVGQYTGLKDKNGTKIFEGDIVGDNDGYIDEVCYREGVFVLGEEDLRFIYGEVIGNIYDNPELLEVDNE